MSTATRITLGLTLSVCQLATAWASGAPRNLVDLSRHASLVVTARVDGFESCPSAGGNIFTYVRFVDVKTLEAERDEAGSQAPPRLVLRVPGGMADGVVEMVSDAPVFRQGEQVLLFLTRDPQQQVPIVHGADGVFVLDADGVVRSLSGAAVTAIDEHLEVLVDPGYRPTGKDARHWDPRTTGVWEEPVESEPLGRPLPREESTKASPMRLEQFQEHLRRAWREADRMGRLPRVLDSSPRKPYEAVPKPPRKGVGR